MLDNSITPMTGSDITKSAHTLQCTYVPPAKEHLFLGMANRLNYAPDEDDDPTPILSSAAVARK